MIRGSPEVPRGRQPTRADGPIERPIGGGLMQTWQKQGQGLSVMITSQDGVTVVMLLITPES